MPILKNKHSYYAIYIYIFFFLKQHIHIPDAFKRQVSPLQRSFGTPPVHAVTPRKGCAGGMLIGTAPLLGATTKNSR